MKRYTLPQRLHGLKKNINKNSPCGLQGCLKSPESSAVLSLCKFTQVSSSVLHHRLWCFCESRFISRTDFSVVFKPQNIAINFLNIEMAAVAVARVWSRSTTFYVLLSVHLQWFSDSQITLQQKATRWRTRSSWSFRWQGSRLRQNIVYVIREWPHNIIVIDFIVTLGDLQ